MKIYTRTGDKGTTSLIGGKRVPKYHQRIEAYGTIDELMAFVALLRDGDIPQSNKDFLLTVLDRLMTCASILAADCSDCNVKIPELLPEEISRLEHEMDAMDAELEPLTSFVLPGGHVAISTCHVARAVCRRAERLVTQLQSEMPTPENVGKYLNRLSDYLFVSARFIAKFHNLEQIKWEPRV